MTRQEFDGIPDVGEGESTKLVGVEYDDRAARRRAEYALVDSTSLETFDTPRTMLYLRGNTEELNDAIQNAENSIGDDGEIYVFQEESQVPNSGFEQKGNNTFVYKETFPGLEESAVEVGVNSYFLSQSGLEKTSDRCLTDGTNYIDWDIDGGRNPEAILEFEGDEDFAGRHSKSFSQWMKETLP